VFGPKRVSQVEIESSLTVAPRYQLQIAASKVALNDRDFVVHHSRKDGSVIMPATKEPPVF
jgi:hypothetical protein